MLSSIIDIATGALQFWEPIKRHASYFIHYDRYIHDLNEHVTSLEAKMKGRQSQANEVGRVPSEEFKCWVKKVEEVQKIAKEIIAHKVGGERRQCFTWLSDLGSRYSLGKKAVKKKALIDELLQAKVDIISQPLPTQVIKSLVNKDFKVSQATEAATEDIMNALQNKGVDIIGLYGMGGVGKTTLAKEIKRRALEQKMFKKAIMVTISQKPNLDTIREKMADQLEFSVERKSVSSEKLFSLIEQVGPVLIILDDMWKSLNLSDIGIPDHCKIILTSRNLEVCKSMRSKKIIQLGVLSSEDSWKMFKYYSMVVESSIDSGDVCSVARKVANECKGLPLVIATVGRALIEKSLPEWEDALVQLRASVPDNISELKDVFMQLKLSYDYLSTEAQSCLLLCSLFPEDEEIYIEQLTLYAMGEGFLQAVNTLQETKNRVLSLVNKLKASCLLLEEGEKGETVKMHDVVRDVAIYIGSNENHEGCLSKSYQNEPDWENVKDCKRLSVINNSICILPEKPPECLHIQTLLLESNSEFSELKTIPDKFFEGMTSLRVLDLCYTSISSLPASMSYLTNLQVLDLDGCWNLEDISALGSQNKLQVLSLRNTEVKVWSEVVGKFTGLKYLDLRGIGKLRIPPKVISNLCQLEELHVGNSFTKWEVWEEETGENAPLHEIQSLIKLKSLSIEVDKYWEGMLDRVFIKLEKFDIVLGPIITNSWTYEKRASLRASLRVNLSNLGLPGWVSTLLRKAERLELVNSSCPQLDATGGDGLQCMKILELEECNEMEFIVIDQNRSSIPCIILPRLKNLQLKNMEKLTGICSSPLPNGSLEELKGLDVDDCSKLNIHQILLMSNDSLEKLFIKRHDSMKEIISTCSASRALLPKLRTMWLDDLPELMSIWKGDSVPPLGSLSNLTFLYVTKCNELRYALSLSLAQMLESLEKLHVNDCKMMEGLIPYDVVVVEAASSTATSFSKSISPFSRIFCNLRELEIQHCSGVFLFPLRVAQNLVHLEGLDIFSCNRMEVIVRGEEGEAEKGEDIIFPRLQVVRLGELPNLTSFCSVVGAGVAFAPDLLLPSLLHVNVDDCPRLTRLPLGSQSSPNLKGQKEWLEGLVWDDEKSKTRMKLELVDSSCPQLDATGGGGLQCMKYLYLMNCNEIEFIVIDQNRSSIPCIILPCLRELGLKQMEKLTGICNSPLPNGSLEELKDLKIDDCPKLNIHQILQQSTSLDYLHISRHDSMKEIISTCSASRALLPRLREMRLADLPELMSIWKGDSVPPLGSLSNLINLSVSRCDKLRYALSLSLAQTLESLEGLYVDDCKTMEGLIPYDVVVVEEASSAATTFRKSISPFSRIFCNLRHLDIQHCLGVFLFPLRLAQNLIHLERLGIAFCNRMEVIVRGEEGEAEKGEDIVSGEGILFPRLQEVELGELPNLTSFCSVVGAGEAFAPVQLLPSLLKVHVHDCPRLTKLPLGSQSSPNLEMVKGEKEWFEGLVWDDEKSKTRFIPLFEVYEVEKEEEDDGEDDEI